MINKALRQKIQREEGNISILTIGLMVTVLMAIALGVAITGVEVDRNRVQFIADGSALYAATAFNEEGIYTADFDPNKAGAKPSVSQLTERVESFLKRQNNGERIESIQILSVEVLADSTVRVRLQAKVHPPLIGWLTRGVSNPVILQVESLGQAQ